jgi:hypothetical protein
MRATTLLFCLVPLVASFPFIADQPGIKNKHLLGRQQSGGSDPGGPTTCPFNPDHVYPVPVSADFPYNGAKGGLPGKGVGGYLVSLSFGTLSSYLLCYV